MRQAGNKYGSEQGRVEGNGYPEHQPVVRDRNRRPSQASIMRSRPIPVILHQVSWSLILIKLRDCDKLAL
jgi:hypothetical protein